MMRTQILATLVLSLASLTAYAEAPAAPAAGAVPPDKVVQQSATNLLNTVASKRDELKAHPEELYSLAQTDLVPYFDFDYASRLVLGLAWRNASDAQRKAFQDAFVKYLVHSYADALLQGNFSDRNLQVEPWNGVVTNDRTAVKTKVLRTNAQPVEVDYQMHNTPQGWKAFDVTIEGISYVLNYRNQFGPEIQQKGLDELIQRLNSEAGAPKPAAASGN